MNDWESHSNLAQVLQTLQKTPVLANTHAYVLHARVRGQQCNLPQHSVDVLARGHQIRGAKAVKRLVVGSCRFLPMCTHGVQVFHTQAVLP